MNDLSFNTSSISRYRRQSPCTRLKRLHYSRTSASDELPCSTVQIRYHHRQALIDSSTRTRAEYPFYLLFHFSPASFKRALLYLFVFCIFHSRPVRCQYTGPLSYFNSWEARKSCIIQGRSPTARIVGG